MQNEPDVEDTLQAIVAAAVGTVPGASHASISSIRRRRDVQTRASSGELARAVDQAQYEVGEGPCFDVLYEQRTVLLPDLGQEHRWPKFIVKARALGVGSMLGVQLYVNRQDLGALSLFSEDRNALTEDSEHIALLFASHAAVAMADAQAENNLRIANTTRDVLGMAKGILMERYKVSEDQAFHILAKASQDLNEKVRDIADALTRTGDLPTR